MIDPIIHPINRFKICATLNAYGAVDGDMRKEMKFSALRERVQISDATLSKQLSALEEAGYISRYRDYGSSRSKDTVWIMLTAKGKAAFEDHLATLREMAGG